MSDSIIIGRLSSAYGIKGWLHLTSFATPPENIFTYQHWSLRKKSGTTPITLEAHKSHGKSFVIKIKGCDDRTAAEALKGLEIEIPKAALPKPEDGSYYWSDLIGLQVVNLTGQSLGIVDHLFDTGANDVIVTTLNKKQHMIPYIDQVIHSIDLEKAQITVDWELL